MGGVYDLWKSIVPMRERFYLQTLFGDREKPLTEEDLTPDELKSIESTIQKAQGNRLGDAKERLGAEKERDAGYESARKDMESAIPVLENAVTQDPDWVEYQNLTWDEDKDRKTELHSILGVRYSKLLPENLRFYILDNPGDIRPSVGQYIESYLTPEGNTRKSDALEEISRLESNFPSNDVQYEDYSHTDGNKSTTKHWDTVGQTLGRFNYNTNDAGEREIKDKYDFHNEMQEKYIDEYEEMGPLEKLVQIAKQGGARVVQGQGIKGMAQSIGNAYVGRDGRKVNIKYDPEAMASGGVVIDDNNPAKRRRLI